MLIEELSKVNKACSRAGAQPAVEERWLNSFSQVFDNGPTQPHLFRWKAEVECETRFYCVLIVQRLQVYDPRGVIAFIGFGL